MVPKVEWVEISSKTPTQPWYFYSRPLLHIACIQEKLSSNPHLTVYASCLTAHVPQQSPQPLCLALSEHAMAPTSP